MTNRSNLIKTKAVPKSDSTIPRLDKMEYFDKLPFYLRQMLNDSIISFCPHQAYNVYVDWKKAGFSDQSIKSISISSYKDAAKRLRNEHYKMLEELTS